MDILNGPNLDELFKSPPQRLSLASESVTTNRVCWILSLSAVFVIFEVEYIEF